MSAIKAGAAKNEPQTSFQVDLLQGLTLPAARRNLILTRLTLADVGG